MLNILPVAVVDRVVFGTTADPNLGNRVPARYDRLGDGPTWHGEMS